MLMDNVGRLDAAEKHFSRAAALGFQPLGATYRLSRIYARTGRQEDALRAMEELAAGGFSLINLIDGEADYERLKDNDRFKAAAETIRQSGFPCEADPRRRAFDFWIGDWHVTQGGQFAGTNHIEKILGGCAIYEQWSSAGGTPGKSFNYYDPGNDHWRQIWLDASGTVVEFVGEARDGGIFFTAETRNAPGEDVTYHKFEFTQNGDGSIRQLWQTSGSKAGPWSTIWDGHYVRMEKP